jgi:hypothetical protein
MSSRPKAPPMKETENMGSVPAPRAPLFAIVRPQAIFRSVDKSVDTVRARLIAGDPSWEEFKRRWAEEYGEP